MEYLLLLLGLLTGGSLSYLLIQRQSARTLRQQKEQNDITEKELYATRIKSDADLQTQKSACDAQIDALRTQLSARTEEISAFKAAQQQLEDERLQLNRQLANTSAENTALKEKLETQKSEIEDLGKRFNTEFENLANRILESKTQKFTELNKTNLHAILEPLGKNLEDFRKVVTDAYQTEAKERFSLGEQVKALADLNRSIGEEARNLTKALKGEAKTQGRWGEMILETILEKSGLRKDEEYFMEEQLTDESGQALRSDAGGKKMRPDAIIRYPDNRSVIVDSKVSLNAFTRYLEAPTAEEQKKELDEHVSAVRNHIISLSTKGYDDYDKALDFVMMFIPSEPAYIAAIQGDPDLWSYAYDRRILLLNPTNLITSLKLIADLWKREQHNQNARDIAERGAKMYDKLVGFVSNLENIGAGIQKAQDAYNESYKQLTSGKDNLVLQAEKMKKLGLKNKKSLAERLTNDAENESEA